MLNFSKSFLEAIKTLKWFRTYLLSHILVLRSLFRPHKSHLKMNLQFNIAQIKKLLIKNTSYETHHPFHKWFHECMLHYKYCSLNIPRRMCSAFLKYKIREN